IYLVGPEVFLPDPHDIDGQKKLICERYGFCGRFTLDSDLELDGVSPRAAGLRISEANEQLMRVCDLVIANITPFRGLSADVGTAYEMGFMRALGKPVLAYTNKTGLSVERVLSRRQSGPKWVDD
ncbi:MAG: nucleoside 2-deoxyribosyltransferase, partial [Acidobacteriota bacterium]|nr:nucleoside 2-deoxyribosyltransferase [Acidobacteriota bacterium]